MYQLNEKIRGLVPYEPLKGEYKIRLDANESFLSVPSYLMAEFLTRSAGLAYNRYPDPMAGELCAAFARAYSVSPENVVAGNGSDELISLIFTSFLMKGEAYATLEQDFSMYDFYGQLSECRRVKIPKDPDFSIDPERVIETCRREGVRLLIFSNPCNPTSLGLRREQVRQIIRSTEALVVLDEAYMDFWEESLLEEAEQYDNLLILRTCSKAYGLAAARVGFAVGNSTLIRALKAVKSPYNVNAVSQMMAALILSHRGESGAAVQQIRQSREELQALLCRLNDQLGNPMVIPESCTNFVTVRFPEAKEYYEYLLGIGIAVRCFEGFVRITAGSRSENAQLADFTRRFFTR